MASDLDISFAKSAKATDGLAIVLTLSGDLAFSGAETADPKGVLARAAKTAGFSGKAQGVLDLLAPEGSPAARLVAIGLGKASAITNHDWLTAGGVAASKLGKAEKATIFLDVPGLDLSLIHI